VQRVAGRLPGLYMIEVDETESGRFFYWRQQARHARYSAMAVRPISATRCWQYEWLYLSGISLSLYGEAVASGCSICCASSRQGGKVAFDSNYRPRAWPSVEVARREIRDQLALTDLVLSSLEDETGLNNVTVRKRLATSFMASGPAPLSSSRALQGCVVSIDGRKSTVQRSGLRRSSTPPPPVNSFNAGFLAATLRGEDPLRARRLGHRCAPSSSLSRRDRAAEPSCRRLGLFPA